MNRGLEALKVLVMSSTTIFNTKEQIDESVKTIKKELKALEIVKKAFDSSSTYTYKLEDSLECGWITQEEYNLLKEVLINESSN